MAPRAAFRVHRRMGFASLLLDLSRCHGSRHGRALRIPGRDHLAEFHERLNPGAGIYGAHRHLVLVRDRLHCAARRERVDLSKHRHQRNSDLSAAGVFSARPRLSDEPCSRSVAFQFDSTSGEAYTYEFATTKTVANGQSTDTIVRDANGVPKPKLDAAGKVVPFHIAYPEKDDKGVFLSHPSAGSVLSAHNMGWVFVQARPRRSCIQLGGGRPFNRIPKSHSEPLTALLSRLIQAANTQVFEAGLTTAVGRAPWPRRLLRARCASIA